MQSDLQLHSVYTFFNQYVCSLGIEPTTFCAANAMLYHWATQEYIPWMQYQSLCKKNSKIKFSQMHECKSKVELTIAGQSALKFPRNYSVITYLYISKTVWLSSFCRTQNIFWRMVGTKQYWSPLISTAWTKETATFFKISYISH